MNEKFKNMWNLDKLFENIVILNVFEEEKTDKLVSKYKEFNLHL
jgi:hypothetical protein